MKTYQDLQDAAKGGEAGKRQFLIQAINEHKCSTMYRIALDAELYMRQLNPTINNYRKLLYTISGKAVPDNYSANHKCASNFFKRFVVQENQFLLGNGVTFNDPKTKDKLGGDKFDTILQQAGEAALVGGLSFGYFNFDKVEMFKLTEFVPLWDEENGSLSAGIRFWQIDTDKPLRITLYEIDGVTEYIKRSGGDVEMLKPKYTYKQIVKQSAADGARIYDGGNYPSFPIVPFWGNPEHQSEIVGIRQQIDAYDLIKSGFANDLDDASMIYWTITNAGGMGDIDLVQFMERLKTIRAAKVDDDSQIQEHTVEIPYSAREAYLTRLENDMYNDFMALNIYGISAGNNTATAINAAYEPLNVKADRYEYCVIQFIQGLLALIGVDDTFTFKRSKVINQAEDTNMILAAAQYLDDETILEKLPFIVDDEVEEIMKRKAAEEVGRYKGEEAEQTEQGARNEVEMNGEQQPTAEQG